METLYLSSYRQKFERFLEHKTKKVELYQNMLKNIANEMLLAVENKDKTLWMLKHESFETINNKYYLFSRFCDEVKPHMNEQDDYEFYKIIVNALYAHCIKFNTKQYSSARYELAVGIKQCFEKDVFTTTDRFTTMEEYQFGYLWAKIECIVDLL